jgi:hypothetical protein
MIPAAQARTLRAGVWALLPLLGCGTAPPSSRTASPGPAELVLEIELPQKPFTPGARVDAQFRLRNASKTTYWVDVLPTFAARVEAGDFVIDIVDEAGLPLSSDCITDDGAHRFYGPLSPGETRRYPHDFSCFGFPFARPGLYTLEARFQPRNEACSPPAGTACFRGATSSAKVKLRWESNQLRAE